MNKENLKKCPSCGLHKIENPEHKICKDCFRALNYGEIDNNLEPFTFEQIITDIDTSNNKFYLILDIHNFPFGIIENINNKIKQENLYILINKIDVFPKSINTEHILDFVFDFLAKNKIYFNEMILFSAKKNYGLDYLNELFIKNKNNVLLGKSNVGKSTLIQAIAKLNKLETFNLTSYTIGTTLDKITLDLNEDTKLIDLPGIYNSSNLMNSLDKELLQKVIPKDEIRVKNYNLYDEYVLFQIDKIGFILLKTEEDASVQFYFSNTLEIERRNVNNTMEQIEDWNSKELVFKDIYKNKTIFINGLGFLRVDKKVVSFRFISTFEKIGIKILDDLFKK